MQKKTFEEVYDEEIYPLMGKIVEICEREGIPVLASFQLATSEEDQNGTFLCTTTLNCEQMEGSLRMAALMISAGMPDTL